MAAQPPAILTALLPLEGHHPALAWTRRRLVRLRAGAAMIRGQLDRRSPEQLFALVIILALVGFLVALLLQPGAVGRGGR